jgi:hypothetical protein
MLTEGEEMICLCCGAMGTARPVPRGDVTFDYDGSSWVRRSAFDQFRRELPSAGFVDGREAMRRQLHERAARPAGDEYQEREAERTILAHALDRAGIHGCASYVQACNGPVVTNFPSGRAREIAQMLDAYTRMRALADAWRDFAKTCGPGQAPVLTGCAADLDRAAKGDSTR